VTSEEEPTTELPCLDSSNQCVEQLTDRAIAPHNSSLPCLDSSNECVNELTEKAISRSECCRTASSNKLKKLDEKIALIDQRLELMEDRIAYSQKKTWTNYVTLDPVKLLQNLFGGGDVQRDRLSEQLVEVEIERDEVVRELEQLF
jgi:hypothetical protein